MEAVTEGGTYDREGMSHLTSTAAQEAKKKGSRKYMHLYFEVSTFEVYIIRFTVQNNPIQGQQTLKNKHWARSFYYWPGKPSRSDHIAQEAHMNQHTVTACNRGTPKGVSLPLPRSSVRSRPSCACSRTRRLICPLEPPRQSCQFS